MNQIKNVLICGLGAIGGYYASRIYEKGLFNLKILVDKERYIRYQSKKRTINGKFYDFEYVLPEGEDYSADLIIIATKSSGLKTAIKNIKNFVCDKTIILSFLNGISSEREIASVYGEERVLYSFLLGHTFFREGNSIEHDGNATIHFGDIDSVSNYKNTLLTKFFDSVGIKYCVHDDIINALWNKFCFNCCANQISALTRKTFGEMIESEKCRSLIKNICKEISVIAERENVSHPEEFYNNTIESFKIMIPDGKTSMLQDVEAGRKPEIDLFGNTVVSLGEKYGIDTPYNKVIADLLELL